MHSRRRFLGLLASVAAPASISSRAFADAWPTKPVRIVVPFTPGGSTDITARLVGNRLQEIWGQTVVIENKGGAGGNIAADMVAHSDADGYTIFISGPGMATNAANGRMRARGGRHQHRSHCPHRGGND